MSSQTLGKSFLKILDEEFPKEHVLHKIFNRNTVKTSYSCISNIKHNIDGHNRSVLNKKNVATRNCNCRKPADCSMNGDYLKQSVVYQATVSTNDDRPDQTYVGLTENSFKTRFTNQRASFSTPSKKLSTELSKHICQLKDSKTVLRDHGRSWNKLHRATPLPTAATYAFGKSTLLSAGPI